jgi:ribosomal protein L37AE/L43A
MTDNDDIRAFMATIDSLTVQRDAAEALARERAPEPDTAIIDTPVTCEGCSVVLPMAAAIDGSDGDGGIWMCGKCAASTVESYFTDMAKDLASQRDAAQQMVEECKARLGDLAAVLRAPTEWTEDGQPRASGLRAALEAAEEMMKASAPIAGRWCLASERDEAVRHKEMYCADAMHYMGLLGDVSARSEKAEALRDAAVARADRNETARREAVALWTKQAEHCRQMVADLAISRDQTDRAERISSDRLNLLKAAMGAQDAATARAKKAEASSAYHDARATEYACELAREQTAHANTYQQMTAAERRESELGLQVVAQAARLRLADDVVEMARIAMKTVDGTNEILFDALAAWDAVPGDQGGEG